jgi:hypothetical protein
MNEKEETSPDSGVRVVGALPGETSGDVEPPLQLSTNGADNGDSAAARGQNDAPVASPQRRLLVGTRVLAALGVMGTLVFGLLWASTGTSTQADPAMQSAARTFLVDLTNFNAKSIDTDFSSITSMATGTFSGQATKFFNSSIRSELEAALAESRGQIRDLYVQSESGSKGAVYAVVDQVYVNNKISTPQADVLRIVVNLQKVASSWKIADVTVLEGATPASAGSASGSAGSTVPGQ